MLNHLVTTALLGHGIPQARIGAHDHPHQSVLCSAPSATAGLLCSSGKPSSVKMIAEPPGLMGTPEEAQLLATTEKEKGKTPQHLGKQLNSFLWSFTLMLCKVREESETREHGSPTQKARALLSQAAELCCLASSPCGSAASSKSRHLLAGL